MSDDHLVVFMPSGKRGRFEKGTPVLDAARQLGVYVESVCGGRGICGRCQVEVSEGEFAKHGISSKTEHLSNFSPKEIRYKEKRGLDEARRLSCSSMIEGDLVIDIPQEASVNRQVVRKDDDGRDIIRNPSIHMCYVEVDEPDMHNPLGDMDRLLKALREQWGFGGTNYLSREESLVVEPYIYAQVQKTLREGKWKVTAAIHQDDANARPRLIALYPDLKNEAYGIACDIGSTTIALHLVSLLSGVTIASSGTSNPQIRFGEDLMSRVSYVMMNPNGVEAMTNVIRKAINELIHSVCKDAGVDCHDVLDTTFVGNPVMHHLFLGIDPTELGGAPFALALSGALEFPASHLGLDINEGARTYMLPCIAGHVGADAAAATLTEGPHRQNNQMLLVDVGTNAEIVLGNSNRVVAASSPTGPAFEGAEISCGQRAAPGAIERVRIDPETLEPRIRIIGVEQWSDEEGFDEAAKATGITGICGSGIIEVMAEMYLAGITSKDGVIQGNLSEKSPRIFENKRTWSYRLWHDEENDIEITVTQNDVRAIQLAKAALYAGIKLLMDKLGLKQVDEIRLAGAFGSFIDPKYALVLGLVPDCALDKVKAVGNAAGIGAKMALLNRDYRREIEDTVRRIEKIETALEPDFQTHFVHAMAFPNKIDAFPELEKVVTLPKESGTEGSSDDGTSPSGGRRRRGARGARRAR